MPKQKTEQRFINVPLPARLDDAIDELASELALSRAAIARLALRSFVIVNSTKSKHLNETRR